MPLFNVLNGTVQRLPETTFQALKLGEREHIQRWLREDISALGDNLLVIAEEFSEWEASARRIDLLCIDDEGILVVVEIKRTEDGGHMELQALRYAAMVSAMTLDQVITARAKHLGGLEHHQAAEASVVTHLGYETAAEASLAGKVRIVLVSQNFSKEITTSVMWLNTFGLDIRCIKLKPYQIDANIILDLQQIIPLPEAADYEMKIKAQQVEALRIEGARHDARRRFWNALIPIAAETMPIFANRTAPSVHWLKYKQWPGIDIGFVILKSSCRAECYIDYGLCTEVQTRDAYDKLAAHKLEIEQLFGHELRWEPLDEGRACRISFDLQGVGWRSPESEWTAAQEEIVELVDRLRRSLEPYASQISRAGI